jgi:EmrB/QacA subfamily drug resistance transporter
MSDPTELPMSQKVATMVGALLGLLLAALDQTIVSTAGPFIQRDLAIAPSLYAWLTTSYLVASTVLVPVYGKLSDIYGRRRLLLIAIGVFLTGSLLCGISQNATQLIAARAIQGAGSAGLFTSAFAVVADLFPPAERSKWQGMFGAAWGVSSVVGPLLGGVLTQNLSWHWCFFVNLPIGAVAVFLIISRMPPLRRNHETKPSLDILGALMLAVAVLPFLIALSLKKHEAVLYPIAAVGAALFIVVELRAKNPILDIRLFKNKTFAIGSLATFIVGGAFLGAIVFLPLFMVNVVGLSATSSGLTITPLTLGIVFANIFSGQLVSRLGSYKGILLASLVILCGMCAWFALTLTPDSSRLSVSAKMILLGVGLGPSIPLFTLAIQTAVPMRQIGVATAAATFFRQMGTTIGIAIIGTIFASSLATAMHDHMPKPEELPPQLAAHMGKGGGGEEGATQSAFNAADIKKQADAGIDASPMPPQAKIAAKERAHAAIDLVGQGLKESFTDALIAVFWTSLIIAGIGTLVTLFVPALPLRQGPPGSRPAPAVD